MIERIRGIINGFGQRGKQRKEGDLQRRRQAKWQRKDNDPEMVNFGQGKRMGY